MTRAECIAAAKVELPVVHCIAATHDAIEYECISALIFKPDGKGGLDMSVELKSKTGNSTTTAKPETIKVKGGITSEKFNSSNHCSACADTGAADSKSGECQRGSSDI